MKTALFATAIALLTAGSAFASEGPRTAVEPSAPVAIQEAMSAGGGTIAGTVLFTDRHGFTVADASGEVRIAAKRGADLQPGEMVTVTGPARHDGIKAQSLVRQDGSLVTRPHHDERHAD